MKTDLPGKNAIPKNRMTINRLFAYTRIPRIRPALTMALCAATLAGCAVGPDYVQPPTRKTASGKPPNPRTNTRAAHGGAFSKTLNSTD